MDDPLTLPVGTEVSAKYKGAFCEAKVSKVDRHIKLKVLFKSDQISETVSSDVIEASLKDLQVGSIVSLRRGEGSEEAVITKIQDCSQYTVVFDDGDITTLRRTALCLKSGRHFNVSETLDQLPLSHPDHFGNPVVGGRRGRRRGQANEESSDDDDEIHEKETEHARDPNIGKVVYVETETKKKDKDKWFPALIVSPEAQASRRICKDEYLIRSFKDGRYYTVPKRETREFTTLSNLRESDSAVQAALNYIKDGKLPQLWNRAELFGERTTSSEEEPEMNSDSSCDEPDERKDFFIAHLYNFMDDRGTPLNKVPSIQNRDVDLYKLFRTVYKRGGYNRVTNQNQWMVVAMRLNFSPCTASVVNLVKQAYKKFLHPYDEFRRKLGCSLLTPQNSNRSKGRTLLRATSAASPKPADFKVESPVPVKCTKTLSAYQTYSGQIAGNATTLTYQSPISQNLSREMENLKSKSSRTTNVNSKKAKCVDRRTEKSCGDDANSQNLTKLERGLLHEAESSSSGKSNSKGEDPDKSHPAGPTNKKGRHLRKQIESVDGKFLGKRRKHVANLGSAVTDDFRVEINDILAVYYPHHTISANSKSYQAKVLRISMESGVPKYLVHYSGWNSRYDEFIEDVHIAENITKGYKRDFKTIANTSSEPTSSSQSNKTFRSPDREKNLSITNNATDPRGKSPAVVDSSKRSARTISNTSNFTLAMSETSIASDSDTNSEEPFRKFDIESGKPPDQPNIYKGFANESSTLAHNFTTNEQISTKEEEAELNKKTIISPNVNSKCASVALNEEYEELCESECNIALSPANVLQGENKYEPSSESNLVGIQNKSTSNNIMAPQELVDKKDNSDNEEATVVWDNKIVISSSQSMPLCKGRLSTDRKTQTLAKEEVPTETIVHHISEMDIDNVCSPTVRVKSPTSIMIKCGDPKETDNLKLDCAMPIERSVENTTTKFSDESIISQSEKNISTTSTVLDEENDTCTNIAEREGQVKVRNNSSVDDAKLQSDLVQVGSSSVILAENTWPDSRKYDSDCKDQLVAISSSRILQITTREKHLVENVLQSQNANTFTPDDISDCKSVFQITSEENPALVSTTNKSDFTCAEILFSESNALANPEQKPVSIADKVLKALSEKKETCNRVGFGLVSVESDIKPHEVVQQLPSMRRPSYVDDDFGIPSGAGALPAKLTSNESPINSKVTESLPSDYLSTEIKSVSDSITIQNNDLQETILKLRRRTPVNTLRFSDSAHVALNHKVVNEIFSEESTNSTDSEDRLIIEDMPTDDQIGLNSVDQSARSATETSPSKRSGHKLDLNRTLEILSPSSSGNLLNECINEKTEPVRGIPSEQSNIDSCENISSLYVSEHSEQQPAFTHRNKSPEIQIHNSTKETESSRRFQSPNQTPTNTSDKQHENKFAFTHPHVVYSSHEYVKTESPITEDEYYNTCDDRSDSQSKESDYHLSSITNIRIPNAPITSTLGPAVLNNFPNLSESHNDSINLFCEETLPGSPAPLACGKDESTCSAMTIKSQRIIESRSSPKRIKLNTETEVLEKNPDPNVCTLPKKNSRRESMDMEEFCSSKLLPLKREASYSDIPARIQSKKRRFCQNRKSITAASSDAEDNSGGFTALCISNKQYPVSDQRKTCSQYEQESDLASVGIRKCPYNFILTLDPDGDLLEQSVLLEEQLNIIRNNYYSVRAEKASTERRLKKKRRRDRENRTQLQNN